MPKGIDPKAYAARVTQAKKRVAAIDPAMKKKLEQYYPKISKEQIARQAMGGKDVSPLEKRMKAKPKPMAPRKPSTGVRKPMPKIEGAKPGIKKPMPKVIGAKPGVRKPMASPTKKSGVVVALPNGSTVGLKDIGKVKPTPKPKPKVTTKAIPTKSDSQYFNDQKKFIESRKKTK
jgi:hypothetical protein